MKITQLCYASKRIVGEENLLDDLREILVKSRDYNAVNDICGILYYAHGYYFQCIQGDYDSIMKLYNKIIYDNRHENIKLIQHKSIEKRIFSKWAMKYVQEDTSLSNFFVKEGLNGFQPHEVNEKVIDDFLDIILDYSESKNNSSNQGFMNRGYSGYF